MRWKVFFSVIFILSMFLSGCGTTDPYFIVGDQEQRKDLRQLFTLLESREREDAGTESRFVIIRQIIGAMRNAGEQAKLNLFLTTYVERYPDDPFNAYYLLVVAEAHKEAEAYPIATHYFDRILKNYQDLIYRDESVHFICLTNLIRLEEHPVARVDYYTELLARFIDRIDAGPTYYFLGRTYGELGEWDLALKSYKNYLSYPDSRIPGISDPRAEVGYMIEISEVPNKNWTYESLDELTQRVKGAIWAKRADLLNRYMSKVSFFTRSWEQVSEEAEIDFLSNLGSFMQTTVRVAQDIDADSNTREAYLWTRGWSHRIRTWYLFFRRVYYPADPEIHGQWEWAGIYFGEKPFIGSAGGGAG